MAEGTITLPPDSTGKKLRTVELTVAGNTVEQEVITLAGSDGTLIAPLSESDFDTKVGSLTETAPASDTASSGVNGRLQRIAQRLTSLIALLPTSLGQKTMANSLAVALASDQTAIPATPQASATVTGLSVQRSTALSNTAIAVKGSAGRIYGWHVYNPNSSSAFVQIYDATAASVTVGTTTPLITLALPSTATGTIGIDGLFDVPITCATAISIAATTTITGGTAPSTGLLAQIFYA